MNARRTAAVLFVLSLLVLAVACQRMPGQPSAAERPIPSEQVMDLETLFDENCAGCHGRDGRGGAAPSLNDPLFLALADAEAVKKIVAEGLPGTSMPPFARLHGGPLTDEQIGALAEQMHATWARPDEFVGVELPPLDPTAAVAGDAGRGAEAYAVFCARCHGAEGRGGPNGGSIVDPAYLGLTSDYGLRTIVVVGRPDLDMPDFRGDVPGRAMTPQEVSDVVAWLRAPHESSPVR